MQFFQVSFRKPEYSGAIFQGHIQEISRLVVTHGKKETHTVLLFNSPNHSYIFGMSEKYTHYILNTHRVG